MYLKVRMYNKSIENTFKFKGSNSKFSNFYSDWIS